MKSDFINYKTQLISPQKGWLFLVIPNDVLGGIKRRVWIKGILNNKPLIHGKIIHMLLPLIKK